MAVVAGVRSVPAEASEVPELVKLSWEGAIASFAEIEGERRFSRLVEKDFEEFLI